MKLHRLTLTNFRGVAHREIDFPDSGVVVLSGANEIGKSSMVEALDLLLECKDRSGKKDVKDVKPTHADVGAEVCAEISTGPYRFEYFKRFHRKPETRLTVLAPRRAQLTGDEAHERVLAMLAETVDTGLWRAQRVLQASSTAPVDLSGCDALARALDVAAGEAAELSGAEPLLIDRIDEEYARYFTAKSGRPTGMWAAAKKRLQAAEAEVAHWTRAVAEVDADLARHDELTATAARLAGERPAITQRLHRARTAAEAVAAVRARLQQAVAAAAGAAGRAAATAAALTERRRRQAEVDEHAARVAAHRETLATAEGEAAAAAQAVAAAEAAEAAADEALVAADERKDRARRAVDELKDRADEQRLAGRIATIDATAAELAAAETELSAAAVTDDLLSDIESASSTVAMLTGRAELVSARLELTAAADVTLRFGDIEVALRRGETWSTTGATPTVVEVADVLTARLVPGASAAEVQAQLDRAQAVLTDALEQAGVTDLDAARAAAGQRRRLVERRNELRATLRGLEQDEDVAALRARWAELRARPAATDVTVTLDDARTELIEATGDRHEVATVREEQRRHGEQARARATAAATRVAMLREAVAAAEAQHVAAQQRLAAERAADPDEAVAAAAEADAQAVLAAEELVAAAGAELAGYAPEAVDAELAEAQYAADALAERTAAVAAELRDVATRLSVYGGEGRKGRLDAARTELAHAAAECERIGRRARAVELLREVMLRHRDTARRRYVEPFRGEVQRLGRLVFGPDFEVAVDSNLCITNRTLAGRTVPYESLSGGAKEQLNIVARLAGAALVAKEDSVPVILDDALGFTDTERLAKMGAVFDAVGGDGQVIVLTCTPERYRTVDGAQHIALTR
ncbi:AAA family ATPase [Mycobacterium sp. MYCO198283]|uniref:AAA family ATPase n=1 Tax=Mycobacterium sp. MYCO198283 TaxID=2883505 RepID=UPI001E2B6989|nr:AAA family ATPase [Mycobacterium sp. MYCO198283]MCG5430725.1 AAA family ATPase [Mycobacterium sp. MYCO198283]